MKITDGQASLTKSETTSLLDKYQDLCPTFETAEADELPPHLKTDYAIELLPDHKLPNRRLYYMNPAEKEELRKLIVKRGFTRPANSPHIVPVLSQKNKVSEPTV